MNTSRLLSILALLALLGGSVLSLSACNTVAGAGQDVSSVGHDVSHGANAVGTSIRNGQ